MEPKNKSKKTAFIVVLGLVAVVIAYLAIFYPWPSDERASGNLAGVEKAAKLQAGNLSEEDVILLKTKYDDLLQSAAFQNVAKSENFQKMVANGTIGAIVTQNASYNAIDIVTNPAFQNAVTNAAFVDAVNAGNIVQAIEIGGLEAMNVDGNVTAALSNADFVAAIVNADVQALIGANDFQALITNAQFVQAFANNDIQALIGTAFSSQ